VPRDLVDLKKQVKAASDILDVISGYIPVQSVGKQIKCVCPFHNDTRPSMQIDRKWQNYHCWSCGAKGDVFTFVEKFEKVGFLEALAILARRAAIAMDTTTSPDEARKLQLFEVVRWAQQKFQHQLLESPETAAARKYLGERQLAGPTVREFGLGFAPLDADWLVKLADHDGISRESLTEVGILALRDENRGHYCRFRDRIMFPIRDAQGRTVGFGGRIMPDSPYAARGPKYYNSPDSPLFNKSELLYGIDKARHAGASAGCLAVVEGYTDVMLAHQSGVANVVATMGTALNTRHVTQLRRFVPRVVLVYDADEGGNTGVDRALEIFVSQDVELAVATLPDGLDPADLLVLPDGVDTFRAALTSAVDALEFKLNQLLKKYESPTVNDCLQMLDTVLSIIATAPAVQNKVTPEQDLNLTPKQELILTRIAQRLRLDLKTVRRRLKELVQQARRSQKRDAGRAEPQPTPMPSAARITSPPKGSGKAPILERQLLQILLAEPDLVAQAKDVVPLTTISHTGLNRMMLELYMLLDAGQTPDLDALRVKLLDRPDLASVAMDLQQIGHGIRDRELYFKKIVEGFAQLKADEEKRALKDQLGGVGMDDDAAIELLRRLQNRSREAG
jgi:DNA primase